MAHDHGCELTVLRRGHSVLTLPSPFNGSVSSKVAKWRYRVLACKKVVHALTFRMYYPVGDGSSRKQASKLYVARLNGSRPCLVGVTKSNKLARQYVDDESRACIDAPI